MSDPYVERLRAYLAEKYGAAPEPQPPPPPRPEQTPRDQAVFERRRLRFLGRVEMIAERLDGRVVLRVERETGESFYARAADDDPNTICTVIDQELERRVEAAQAAERHEVERLRSAARRLEDDGDRRHARQEARARAGRVHDEESWLDTAGGRYVRLDGKLFEREALR